MSVIQRIRNKAWIIFTLIAVALISFILQDAFKRTNTGNSGTETIGKVDGREISTTDFQKKVAYYENVGKQNNQPYTQAQLVSGVWDQLVAQQIIDEQNEKLGITFTGKELDDVLFGDNPPDWAKQFFSDPTTGLYDPAKARQQFAQLKQNASSETALEVTQAYLEPTKEQTLRTKYQTLITQAVYVPKWMAEKLAADDNALAKISYVTVPYTTITDSTVKVSDDEIEAYVKKHPKMYEQKQESRSISYVLFNAAASKDDSSEVVGKLNNIKADFASSTDVASYVGTQGTELPYYNSYLSKSVLRQKANDSLFNLPVGSIYGPYIDGNNYVIARMVDSKVLPDTVKVRHILVSTVQQNQQTGETTTIRSDTAAQKRLDSAVAKLRAGEAFDSVCLEYSDDGNKDKGGIYDAVYTGQMVAEFNDFIFTGKPGENKIVKTQFGYHYIEILSQKGSEPAYKIAYISKSILPSQQTISDANNAAEHFAATSTDKSLFDANAKKLNKQVSTSQQPIKENDFSIDALSDCRELVKWTYKSDVQQVSEPIKVGDNYVVAMVATISKPGLPDAVTARPYVEPLVKNEKKAKTIIDSKIKGASIEAIAQTAGVPVGTVDSIAFSSLVLPNNLGNEIKVIGAAFNKQQQGKLSIPIAGSTGVFVIKGESIYAKASLTGSIDMQRQNLTQQLQQQLAPNQYRDAIMEILKKAADIKDYRSQVY